MLKARAILSVVMAAGLLWLLWTLAVTPSQGAGPDPSRHPRLESALRDLVLTHRTGGASATADFAARHGAILVEGLVRVVAVGTEKGDEADISQPIAALGGQVEAAYGPWTQALLPVEALPALANTPGVRFVRRPWLPALATTSEGVAVTGADGWHVGEMAGQGVKVGVLDLGFLGYTQRMAEGELPADVITRSFVGTGSELDFWGQPATEHGTACAEVIHDMAPAAKLYLANAGTEVQWANAVDWLVDQEVDLISFSAGWEVLGPGDGTGPAAEKVSSVREAGVLWINAAGNSARQHWMGEWEDPEGNGWHNYTSTDETNEITVTNESQIVVGLRWNDGWGSSANDYDLLLYRRRDGLLEEIARSDNVQDGDDDPVELIVYYFPPPDVYYVAISKQPGTKVRTLELFSRYQDFHYRTAASSLWVPADSPGSLTVGATYWQDDALEAFSSQGPTRDGRTKPDLVAPDGVSVRSETWRDAGFYGTSASAPHAAGAAALAWQISPTFTPTQTQSWLEGRAVDLGKPGKDNAYGAGRLSLGDPPLTVLRVEPPAALQGQTVAISVFGVSFAPTATLRFTRTGEPDLMPLSTGWISSTQLTGTLDLSGVSLGFRTAVVTHSPAVSAARSYAFLVASDQGFLPLIVKHASP